MISIGNVTNISTQLPGQGLSNYNTANLLCLTNEAAIGGEPYILALASETAKTKYGSASKAYQAAKDVFAQTQNIRNNNGYLAIASIIMSSIELLFSSAADAGGYTMTIDGFAKAITFDMTPAAIQTLIRTTPQLANVTVEKTGNNLTITNPDKRGEDVTIVISLNTLTLAAAPVVITEGEVVTGETIEEALLRLKQVVAFAGVIETFETSDAETLALAPLIQDADNKMIRIICTGDEDDVETGGIAVNIREQNFTRTRHLFKTGSVSDRMSYKFAYASRMMSTNFNAENQALTDHMKDLVGVSADQNVDDTLLQKIVAAGSVCYPSIQGIAKVFSSGKNWFFDRVHNLFWLIGAAQIAYFNVLAKSKNKLPQTDAGMGVIVKAVSRVLEQGVSNGYIAPGEWTSEDFFGDKEDFLRNIREVGYYVYYAPLNEQSPEDREERLAVPVQIAFKEAGAIHKGNVILSINP